MLAVHDQHLARVRGQDSDHSVVAGALIGIVPGLGQFSVITAVLTWILMMFLA